MMSEPTNLSYGVVAAVDWAQTIKEKNITEHPDFLKYFGSLKQAEFEQAIAELDRRAKVYSAETAEIIAEYEGAGVLVPEMLALVADWTEAALAGKLWRQPGFMDHFSHVDFKHLFDVADELDRRGNPGAAERVREFRSEVRHTITVQATGRKDDIPTEIIGWLVDQEQEDTFSDSDFDARAAFHERFPGLTAEQLSNAAGLAMGTYLAFHRQAEAMEAHYSRLNVLAREQRTREQGKLPRRSE